MAEFSRIFKKKLNDIVAESDMPESTSEDHLNETADKIIQIQENFVDGLATSYKPQIKRLIDEFIDNHIPKNQDRNQ